MQEVLSSAGLGKCISGTILFEETLYDKCGTGETFIELLKKQVRMPAPATVSPATCGGIVGWSEAGPRVHMLITARPGDLSIDVQQLIADVLNTNTVE